MPTCDGCPLASSRCCGSRGPEDADIVVVGEAPGRHELARGEPFVGASGKLLDSLFVANGYSRHWEGVFVTNALRCMPERDTQIAKPQIEPCRPRLLGEIDQAPRKLILALGNTAVRAITGNYATQISKVHGHVILTAQGPMVASYHPAAILRNRTAFKSLADDVRYALDIAAGTAVIRVTGPTDYHVVTPDEIPQLIAFLRTQPLLALDIETTGLQRRRDTILALGITWTPNRSVIVPGWLIPRLRPVLAPSDGDGPRLLWHNGKFDTAFLRSHGIPARVDEDSMLLHYATDERKGTHGLKQLSEILLGADDYAALLKPYLKKEGATFANLPYDLLNQYLAQDSDYTYRIFHQLAATAPPYAAHVYRHLLLPANALLADVEDAGILIDQPRLAALGKQYLATVAAHRATLTALAAPVWDAAAYQAETGAKVRPAAFLPTSNPQVLWVLGRFGYTLKKADAATLAELPPNTFVATLLAHRRAAKFKSTYVDGIATRLDDDGRIRSTFLIHGTETGRLSSADPNLQNTPGEVGSVKGIFVARPGCVFVEMDYSQAELRTLAHLARDVALTRIYLDGRDLHSEVAAGLFGPQYTRAQRRDAKTINFGIPYGITAKGLAEKSEIPANQCQRYIDSWLARFPQARDYLQACRRAPLDGRALLTPFGRRRGFGWIGDEKAAAHAQNEASNFPVQSVASDLTLIAAIVIRPQLPEGARIVNLVHDSILIEVPIPCALDVARLARREMIRVPREALGSAVPFDVDVKVGTRWDDLHETEKELLDVPA